MKKKLLTALLGLALAATATAHGPGEHHPRNEVGLGGGAVYCPTHGEWGGGMHLHFFRTFSPESRWAWGAGVEQVWTDESHWGLNAGVRYMLLDRLEISAMPGVMWMREEHGSPGESRACFSAHADVVWNLVEWKGFHLGPALDYGWAKHDQHVMLGLHAACCF